MNALFLFSWKAGTRTGSSVLCASSLLPAQSAWFSWWEPKSKTLQECKTALTSQYQTIFVVVGFLSFCLFETLWTDLVLPLADGALHPQHQLLRRLGLLPQNRLRLTTEALLLAIIPGIIDFCKVCCCQTRTSGLVLKQVKWICWQTNPYQDSRILWETPSEELKPYVCMQNKTFE